MMGSKAVNKSFTAASTSSSSNAAIFRTWHPSRGLFADRDHLGHHAGKHLRFFNGSVNDFPSSSAFRTANSGLFNAYSVA